ncbi:MAG: hypothetical protein JO069_01780, partial [Verrucomicrobia bacterium]|nr:hypothetical protein [Verrucomicrobiota bacterium]
MSAAAGSPPPPPLANPWKGLHFYTEGDRNMFFGRERDANEFLRLIQRDTLSVLFARSGLGKTSLLRAGVVPRLREEGFFPVIVRTGELLSPQPAARRVLELTLTAAAQAQIEVVPVAPASTPGWSGTLWEFFHAHEFWGPRNDLLVPVIIFDQFEEVFTLGRNEPEAARFVEQLADLAENRMPQSLQRRIDASGERLPFDAHAQNYKVVLSLREDFVPKLDSLRPVMPAVMRNRFALEPLSRANALAVIGRAGGQWVSEAVAGQIVSAVAGEGETDEQPAAVYNRSTDIEPAYLSVMCHELFRRMVESGRSTIGSDLVAAERGNILAALYERSFEGLDPKARVFVEERLLTSSGFRGTVPVAEAEHEGASGADLEKLVDRRLLCFEDRLGTTHVELSHDLLTRVAQKSRTERRAEAER